MNKELNFVETMQVALMTNAIVGLSPTALQEAGVGLRECKTMREGGFILKSGEVGGRTFQFGIFYSESMKHFAVHADFISHIDMYKRLCSMTPGSHEVVYKTQAGFDKAERDLKLRYN